MEHYIKRGENAYYAGITKNPYTQNTLAYHAWNQGWKDAERLDISSRAAHE